MGTSNDEVYTKIENSLIQSYLDGDSYMAKVFGGGMTNARALQVRVLETWKENEVGEGY